MKKIVILYILLFPSILPFICDAGCNKDKVIIEVLLHFCDLYRVKVFFNV